jgi:glucose/arabinose dehydrogenase
MYNKYTERIRRKHLLSRILSGLLGIMFLLSGPWNIQPGAAQGVQDPQLNLSPLQQDTNALALPPADEATRRIHLPTGFAIRIFATNLSHPRLMAVGPDGWLYVALLTTGQIARLPDRDHNGLVDRVEIVASGLNEPHNMAFYANRMFVAENDRIDRLADLNNDGIYETRRTVTNNIPGPGGHSTRTVHVGPDGKLYVSVGSSCNICVETDPRRAAILRFNIDGTIPTDNPYATSSDLRKRPVWATGLRNSVDFLWTPSGALWASTMGSDSLGDNLPAEVLIDPVQKGKWYGWPYCYNQKLGLNQTALPLVRDTRLALPSGVSCSQAVPAMLTYYAHSAPIGMSPATGSAFPASYRDDFFITLHGSWNTSDPANYRDCKVERINIENGAVVRIETFATGWRAAGKLCGDATTWGRPAGITFGSDGAMYISDDKGGRIYRVVTTGP